MNARFMSLFLAALTLVAAAPSFAEPTDPPPIVAREVDAGASDRSPEVAYTETRKAQDAETVFQQRLAPVSREIDAVSSSISQMRRSTEVADRQDLDQIEQRIAAAEQEVVRISDNQSTPIAKLQASELQDKLFQLRLSLDALKKRYGWSRVPIFGLDFFANSSSTQDVGSKLVPKNYIIRPGDTILVSLSSSLGGQREYSKEVDDSGKVLAPGIGRIAASGKTIAQLASAINAGYRREFPQLKASLAVDKITPVSIRVAGAVVRPGTYLLPGSSTVFDALYKVGGPTAEGTMRKIALTRSGQPKLTIDLYDFLIEGSKAQDIPLRDGDVIFVPSVGQTIMIDGEVLRAGRYEPSFPLTLGGAISLAGGAKPSGYLQNVSIERVENSEYKIQLEAPVAVLASHADFTIRPGDEITVSSIRSEKTNRVSIEGPVNAPGTYGLKDKMRVSDLVKAAQGLSKNDEIHWKRADILRVDPVQGATLMTFDLAKAMKGDADSDVELRKLDRVFIYVPDQVNYRTNYCKIAGSVAKPGSYRRTDGMKFSDIIAAAGGVMPNAYVARADIVRWGQENHRELVRVDIASALAGRELDDIVLTDRDEISIYTQDQVKAGFPMVRISGAVQRPGMYDRTESMRVSDLLFASGGALPEASDTAEVSHVNQNGELRVTRVNVATISTSPDQDIVLNDGDVVSLPSVNPALRTPMTVTVTGEVIHPGTYTIDPRKTKLADVIGRAGGLSPIGDIKGLIFLRKKDSYQRSTQQSELQLVTEKMADYVNKQFTIELAKASGKPVDAQPSIISPVDAKTQVAVQGAPGLDIKPETQTDTPVIRRVKAEVFPEVKAESLTAMGPKIEGTAVADPTAAFRPDDPLDPRQYGRIGVDLDTAMKNADSMHNLILKDGDRILVQAIPETVTVVGAVLNPHSFVAEDAMNISYYVERSGGYAPDASRSNVIVIHGNGDAVPAKAVKRVAAGDIIYVPASGLVDVASKTEKVGSVTKIITDVLTSAFILTKF